VIREVVEDVNGKEYDDLNQCTATGVRRPFEACRVRCHHRSTYKRYQRRHLPTSKTIIIIIITIIIIILPSVDMFPKEFKN